MSHESTIWGKLIYRNGDKGFGNYNDVNEIVWRRLEVISIVLYNMLAEWYLNGITISVSKMLIKL